MLKSLFQDVPEEKRAQMLSDNCDQIEESLGYMKPFTPDEILSMKDNLADLSININEIELEQKEVKDQFKARLKPLVKKKGSILTNIKNKAEFVKEDCYKFIDHEDGMVGFYNSSGDLVQSRRIQPDEMQKTIFSLKTGTNN
jgi:hypothetical protein